MRTIEVDEEMGGLRAFFEYLKTGNQEHKHKCPSCEFIWDHDPDDMQTQDGCKRAHCCPKCGTEQWEKYFGPDKSKCLNTGDRIQYRP